MSSVTRDGSENNAGGKDVSLFAERSTYVNRLNVVNAAGIVVSWFL